MRRILFSTLFLFCLGTMGAYSESEIGTEINPFQLPDSIIVTANRFGVEKQLIVWPVAMIDPHQSGGGVTLGEKLDGQAGIDIRQYGGVGSITTLSSWGMFNRNMLLLYDGRVVRDLYLGGFNLAEFSADEFERIELVKGPQSAFYGSNAVGGVLNLIPRNSFDRKIKLISRYGTDRQRMMRLDLAHWLKPKRLAVGAYAEFGAADNNRANSGTDRQLFGLRADYLSPDSEHKISLASRFFKDSLGVPGPLPDQADIPFFGNETASTLNDYQQDENISLDLNWTYQASEVSSVAMNIFWERKKLHYFSRYHLDETEWSEASDVQSHSRYDERLLGVGAKVQRELAPFSLALGVDFLNSTLDVDKADTTIATTSQSQTSNQWDRPQDQWEVWGAGAWQLSEGVRFDLSGRLQMVQHRKSQPSYNLGLILLPDDRWRLKMGLGYAFRLPTLDEQFARDIWYIGNENLSPEISRSMLFSIGFTDESGRVDIAASLFSQRVDSMIQFYTDPDSWQTTYLNINKFRSLGLDFDLAYRMSEAYRASFNLVYQRAEQSAKDDLTMVPADYVPQIKWHTYLSGSLLRERLRWQMSLVYTSDRGIILFDGTPKRILKVYELGARFDLKVTDRVSLKLSGSDLTDQARPDQFGFVSGDGDYPTPGRRFMAEVTLALQ